MSKTHLLIVSDSVNSYTGLGRITRELSWNIHNHLSNRFSLATYGMGRGYSTKFPWPNYECRSIDNCATLDLPYVWNDFAGDEKGIVLFIWNPSWLRWLSDYRLIPDQHKHLREFLESQPFEKWGYFPVDSEGFDGKLPADVGESIAGFDRILTYTDWATGVISRTLGFPIGAEWLPHGIDDATFHPRNPRESRQSFMKTITKGQYDWPITDEKLVVGIVATNTQRKHWALGFNVCRELLRQGRQVILWAHTDQLRKYWDLESLASASGMGQNTVITTTKLNDEEMAQAYSACDVTLGIGYEGWGYPAMESLACGTPVITGNYAGCTQFVPERFLVEPVAWDWDGFFCHKKPVFRAENWVSPINSWMSLPRDHKSLLDPQYYWENLWPKWEKWLLEGLAEPSVPILESTCYGFKVNDDVIRLRD